MAAAGPTLAAATRVSGTVAAAGVTIELDRTGVIESPYAPRPFFTVHR